MHRFLRSISSIEITSTSHKGKIQSNCLFKDHFYSTSYIYYFLKDYIEIKYNTRKNITASEQGLTSNNVVPLAVVTRGHVGRRKKREHMGSTHFQPQRFSSSATTGNPVSKHQQISLPGICPVCFHTHLMFSHMKHPLTKSSTGSLHPTQRTISFPLFWTWSKLMQYLILWDLYLKITMSSWSLALLSMSFRIVWTCLILPINPLFFRLKHPPQPCHIVQEIHCAFVKQNYWCRVSSTLSRLFSSN